MTSNYPPTHTHTAYREQTAELTSSIGLVSVLIPVWKIKWLPEAIESVLNQTYNNIELIVVNDCAPYDVESIVKRYHDSRIKYYENKQNIGGKNLVEQWNKCLSYAHGEFVCLLGDDDKYEPDFILTMTNLASYYTQCNVFRSKLNVIDDEGRYINFYPSSPEYESMQEYLWHILKNYRRQTVCEFMYRTNTLKKLGGWSFSELGWGADYLTVLKVALNGGIASTTTPLACYRDSSHNISSIGDEYLIAKLNGSYTFYKAINDLIRYCEVDMQESLYKLNNSKHYDAKHWLLNSTSLKGLFSLLKHRSELHDVSAYVIFKHIIDKLVEPFAKLMKYVESNVKTFIKKIFKIVYFFIMNLIN